MTPIRVTLAMLTLSTAAFAQSPPAPAPATAAAQPAAPQAPALDESKRVSAEEIDKLLADGKVLLLDVREPKEIEELGTLENSTNIPIGQLEKRLHELPKDHLILTA